MDYPSLLIKNATIVTLNTDNLILAGNVLIEGRRIVDLEPSGKNSRLGPVDWTIDAAGSVLLPGFVQTHLHLCQTLFRGSADDLSLIDWLSKRIWPMEAAHTPDSVYASARLAIAELIRGGTTCALTMETVYHTEDVLRAVEESGFRAIVGKCLMDIGDDVPARLLQTPGQAIEESILLFNAWNGKDEGRIRCCFAPRFALSCSRELLESTARYAENWRAIVHTHAAESKAEVDQVVARTGMRNIEYLNDTGILSTRTVLAHCVWPDEGEIDLLARSGAKVAHCPSSNLKLGSGVAPVPDLLKRGVSVSLGADGAACNNRLDMFTEMRTAALLQKPIHGPESIPALAALRMATIEGARALGLESKIGSIEPGKRADLVLLDVDSPHMIPRTDIVSAIVYSATASDVMTVIIDGRLVMRDRELLTLDEEDVLSDAKKESARLLSVCR